MSFEDNKLETTDLGFIDKIHPLWLKSKYFPSKVGGKPAWLSLGINILKPELNICPHCNIPRSFLMQIYSPIEDNDSCFHRTLYVFVCKSEECNNENKKGSLIILRSQLECDNDYYSSSAPNYDCMDNEIDDTGPTQQTCGTCGLYAQLKCINCTKVFYCSKEHQKIDWKYEHKEKCNKKVDYKISNKECEFLFPEFDLLMEEEPVAIKRYKSQEERIKEYNEMQKDGMVGTMHEADLKELEESTKEIDDDFIFQEFKEKIVKEPNQILRHQRHGEPLYVSSENVPMNIPLCQLCGSTRVFEFQILPQLLNSIPNREGLDFGTLIVYTCKNSCDIGNTYAEEYIYNQPIRK